MTLAKAVLIALALATPAAASETVKSRPPALAEPPFTLAEEIADRNPAGFARRLSDLLGVEVRLPARGFRKLVIPAGEWTATKLLNEVVRQCDGASWSHVFELRARVLNRPATPASPSKVFVGGKITLRADGKTFPQVVQAIQELGSCEIRLPNGTPPGRFRVAWKDAPLDRVLADLAAAGSLRLVPVVVVATSEEAAAEVTRSAEERRQQETLQQAEVSNRLQELYGVDPTSDEFPWDNLDRESLSRALGRELDIDPVLVDTLMERLRLEGLTRRGE